MFLSRPNFFRRGVTCANLNLSKKEIWDIDRLARLEIISENTAKQELIRDVGMKSIEDNLLEDLLMSWRTSAGVTEGNVLNGVPLNGSSGILVGWRKDETLLLMVSWIEYKLHQNDFSKDIRSGNRWDFFATQKSDLLKSHRFSF